MNSFDADAAALTLAARGPGVVTYVRRTPARVGRDVPVPGWVAPAVRADLTAQGITRLWEHQARAAQAVWDGRHTVVATGTASGKSLAYLLPALSRVAEGRGRQGSVRTAGRGRETSTGLAGGPGAPAPAPPGRDSTVLYLSPTKALAADQAARVGAFASSGVRAATYDGDTPPDERRWIRRHATYVLTNPDMLHHGILPGHPHWSRFLRALTCVVVDECHAYRGVFGSHVASVLRRLRRLADRYGATPTFVFASATVGDPAAHAGALLGLDVFAVTDDTSTCGASTHVFLDPRGAADESTPRPDAAPGETAGPGCAATSARVLADLVDEGVQTVVFTRSRQGAEVVAAAARRRLGEGDADPAPRVAAYRGGYLPEDRRALEQALRSGRLTGVATTSALESGVDISGLDAVVLAGWPGTRAAWWQRAGRAGRTGTDSLVVYVAADDPLDAYVVTHPQTIFDAPVEACVFDPANPHVLHGHLAAAAAELPLTPGDVAYFGSGLTVGVEALVARGLLRRRPTGWFWTREDRPTDHVSLRGAGGEAVRVVEVGTGRVLGTVDAPRADAAVHTGAVHLHQQRPYVVTELDLPDAAAHVVAGDPGWSTQARAVSAFDLVRAQSRLTWGAVTMSYGAVAVRSQVTSFVRRAPDGRILGEHALDLPERTLRTTAVWWTITPEALEAAGVGPELVPGAAHAAEHAAIGLLPLLAVADRWDIGGVSTARHPDTGLPTVLVYDGHPGGAGFAERGHAMWRSWLRATRDTVAGCPCASGCPSCVQSPKCGNGNEPLDKAGAVRLLDVVLTAGECAALPALTPRSLIATDAASLSGGPGRAAAVTP